jgi:hypothetical protein
MLLALPVSIAVAWDERAGLVGQAVLLGITWLAHERWRIYQEKVACARQERDQALLGELDAMRERAAQSEDPSAPGDP